MSLYGIKENNLRFNNVQTTGLGMEMRGRPSKYKGLVGVPRSIYYQSNFINTVERSVGMPENSGQNIYTRLINPSGLQISSTSINDTNGGTGAISIYIDGILYNDGTWINKSTFSTPTTLNGQTPVQIGTNEDWYRINKIWVLTSGTNETNIGDLYISPLGTTTTLGVPDSDILQSVIAGYGNSTGGYFSVCKNQTYNYTFGNFYTSQPGGSGNLRAHEYFYQDFNGSGNTSDMTKYEVGVYQNESQSYNYTGAAAYTELTDIGLTCYTTSGTSDSFVYYVEYVLTNKEL